MAYADVQLALQDLIRKVPDFPMPGVVFEDLTPVLADADGFRLVTTALAEEAQRYGCDIIAGLDARGFLLGAAVAHELGLGVLAVRKQGKLPPSVLTEEYDLEYGSAALEIPSTGVTVAGKRVVIIDDVLATGGTMAAAKNLMERGGGIVTGTAVVIEVPGLGGRERLEPTPVSVLKEAVNGQ
ncbi:adenine phosphoribosyltransferase [Corynebacterium ulceribovis]|uniref:adenine phosphoribosyltransferase n=1 Tax=Corynebacterium ulceribovis TaxID=487732 RepID=UPI00035E59C5|nr:adenine phosphoribosyltransferase [Corynebacterium ulceribovis]